MNGIDRGFIKQVQRGFKATNELRLAELAPRAEGLQKFGSKKAVRAVRVLGPSQLSQRGDDP